MTEITSDVIDAFVAARKKADATNSEINRELGVLKRAFTLATRLSAHRKALVKQARTTKLLQSGRSRQTA